MRISPVTMWLVNVTLLFSGNVVAAVLYWNQPRLTAVGTLVEPGQIDRVPPLPDRPPQPSREPQSLPIPYPPPQSADPLQPSDLLPPQVSSGDCLLLLLDTHSFRKASDDWIEQLRSLRDRHEDRLLGRAILVVDRQGQRMWTTKQDFPIERQPFANDDADGAFAAAFKAIRAYRNRTVNCDFQSFLLWSSDVNPDAAPRKQTLSRPDGWLKLLWQGSPEPSMWLTDLFGDERIVRFKLVHSGLDETIDFYLPTKHPEGR